MVVPDSEDIAIFIFEILLDILYGLARKNGWQQI